MADRTWAEVRAALLEAVRLASRLPNPERHVSWSEDPGTHTSDPMVTIEITSTIREGQRIVEAEIPCLADPTAVPPVTAGQFTDVSVGVSRLVTFVTSIRVETIRNDRTKDALHWAETIRSWLYEHTSPGVATALAAAGVVYVDELALTPIPNFSLDSRRVKAWVLDVRWRAEIYLASTERTTTIDRVEIAGEVDVPPLMQIDTVAP